MAACTHRQQVSSLSRPSIVPHGINSAVPLLQRLLRDEALLLDMLKRHTCGLLQAEAYLSSVKRHCLLFVAGRGTPVMKFLAGKVHMLCVAGREQE